MVNLTLDFNDAGFLHSVLIILNDESLPLESNSKGIIFLFPSPWQ